MAFPTLIYNTSGSDTAASGAGPTTAVTGTSAAHTGGVGSTTITLTNTPDLSGVASDGSAALWLNTGAGGRHISKITAVDDGSDTVTVEDSFNIAGASAVDYAIGGKRAFWEADTTNTDWDDSKAGWTHEVNDGTFLVTVPVNPQAGDDTDGPVTFKSTNRHGATLDITSAIITFSTATTFSNMVIDGFKFTKSSGASSASSAFRVGTTTQFRFSNNDVNAANMGQALQLDFHCTFEIEDNDIYGSDQGTLAGLITMAGGLRTRGTISRNVLHDSTFDGISAGGASSFVHATVIENLFFALRTAGDFDQPIDSDNYVLEWRNNTVDNMSGDGLTINDATPDLESIAIIEGNIFSNITGIAVDASASIGVGTVLHVDFNCMFGNGTDYNNVTAGVNDVNADPKYKVTTLGSEDYYLQATSPCIDAMPSGPPDVPTPATKAIGALEFTVVGGGGDPFPSQGIQGLTSGVAT